MQDNSHVVIKSLCTNYILILKLLLNSIHNFFIYYVLGLELISFAFNFDKSHRKKVLLNLIFQKR